MGVGDGSWIGEFAVLVGLGCPPFPAARIFDVLAPDTPVLWLVLPKISAELPLVADGLAGTGGKVSPPLFCAPETFDAVPAPLFSWRPFEYLIAHTAIVAVTPMPSDKTRISFRRVA